MLVGVSGILVLWFSGFLGRVIQILGAIVCLIPIAFGFFELSDGITLARDNL